ncbi:MAG: pantoate--beta-alanine ligase [Candidatus Magnetomorum sp.]|nr:pantoate--beta-alanine ligase [Candidatus Magnetomorum sp.]
MRVIEHPTEMQLFSNNIRQTHQSIGFVPTMGYLHQGHISLLDAARQQSDQVVLSIFVNPTQFSPGEDLSVYPKDLPKDLDIAEKAGVDIVFTPTDKDLYGDHYQTYVQLKQLPNYLCGIHRPTHFQGVATVVTKLFNMVKPHVAFFGEKDYQQLAVIRQMVQDLNFDITIIGCPIVRESDGLAMSSRNVYLSKEQRQTALILSQSLYRSQQKVTKGITDAETLINEAKKDIESLPETRIDYVRICNKDTLEDLPEVMMDGLMALAVHVGRTRLIDNRILTREYCTVKA